MTDSERKDLIKRLGAKSNRAFDDQYSEDNRVWFVGKIIESLPWQATAAADIESKTKDIIAKAGVALNARLKKGFSAGSLAVNWKLYDQLKSRVQIIYGLIAMHPQFLDAANEAYFDFVLERRFRSIQRMNFHVNPNRVRGVFEYPNPPEKMQVNKDPIPSKSAQTFWKGEQDGSMPFILSDAGKLDPVLAVLNLFNKKPSHSERNLFACDPVVTALHMDALLVAKNAEKLLKALVSVGDHYLKIDNPLGHFANHILGQRLVAVNSAQVNAGQNVDIEVGRVGPIVAFVEPKLLTEQALRDDNYISLPTPNSFMIVQGGVREVFAINAVNPVTRMVRVARLTNSYKPAAKIYVTRRLLPFYSTLPFHFISDSRPDRALFEQVTVKSVDLQVGDHVYVINHPLYRIFWPGGAWGGEHAFVSEIDSRDSAAPALRSTLKLEGHGLRDTLLGMCTTMLEDNNIVLATMQALTKIHLNYLKDTGRRTTAKVTFIERLEPTTGTSTAKMNVFEYRVPYTYSVVIGGQKKTNTKTNGFVIKEQAAAPNSAFEIFNNDGTDSIVDATHPRPDAFLGVVFIGSAPAEAFTLSKWATPYFNAATVKLEALPLFAKDNKTPTVLTFEDLVKAKPFMATDDVGDVYVTRPRVDFSATYQKFLQDNGAI
ncbi:MAG TPA: hypothetical protein VIS99_02705 [Terrimicrobiaceae bacterium]